MPDIRRLLFFCFLTLCFLNSSAQIDREFWFAAPDIARNHGDSPIVMRVSTLLDTAHIILRMPAGLWFAPINLTIPPNSNTTINLTPWIDSIENKPPNTVLNRGLYLTSDNIVTCYYEIKHNNNPGIFSLKGKNAKGTEFYIVSQNDYRNQVGQESFDIVATEDNTTVTITPTDTIVGHAAGVSFQVTLNKGQTFTARAVNITIPRTLAGSHITSDKPIAISWQDDSIYQGGAYDVICDQIVPNDILGLEYIAIRGYANTNERVYAVGTQDTTIIRLDGNPVPVDTIDAGELYKYQIATANNTAYLKTSKPVQALHLSGFNNEFGGAILPQDSCTGSPQIGFFRSGSGTFALLILTRNGNQDSFYIDGDNSLLTAADFTIVPGTSNAWVYARKQFSTSLIPIGSHLIKNTLGKFHMGILNNLGASSEYGYFSDFSSLYLGADASMCPGDSMVLDGGAFMTSYQWKKLISGIWTLIDTNRFYTITDTGSYACMTNGDNCTLLDTIHISYYPNATVNLGPDVTICEGTLHTFDPGLFVSYEWSTGAISRYLTTGDADEYWVKVVNNNNCIARDTVILYLDSLPQANYAIAGPDTVCQRQSGMLYSIDSLHFATSYQWTLPPGASGFSSSSSITVAYSGTATSGPLKVRGLNSCGAGPDTSLMITVKPFPGPASPVKGPDTVCQNSTGILYYTDSIAHAAFYSWILPPGFSITSGSGTDSITVAISPTASSGSLVVKGNNDCGTGDSAYMLLQVNLFPFPAGPVTGPDSVCQGASGVSYQVDSIPGASSYIWTLPPGASIPGGNGTRIITVVFDSAAVSGNITVRGHSNDCGDGNSSVLPVTLNPLPVPAGPVVGDANVCQGQSGVPYVVNPILHASSYIWTLPPGAVITSGNGTRQITVDYSVIAMSGPITVRGYNDTCGQGRHSVLHITVDPLPLAAGNITGTTPVCQYQSGLSYSVSPIQYATGYFWSYSGAGATITNNGATAVLDFSTTATSGNLAVTGTNACGTGNPSPGFAIHVNPKPDVFLQICQTATTRDAQPFLLKGGIPLGGTYSGNGVSGGWFYPYAVPPALDSATVTYTYNNMYSCDYYATQKIRVSEPLSFSCGDSLTDIRDNRKYGTVQIGSQCWMSSNLNYGVEIPYTQHQLDNCIPERYRNPASSIQHPASVYQWNELMQYEDSEAIQGLCPPGWHIPTEAEWNTLFGLYISNGFAGSALKASGYSGFNALLTGISFHNSVWKFPSGDPVLRSILFWSSTARGPKKAWAHGMNEVVIDTEYTPSVSFYPALRSNAFGVRCIRD
jgi:uncharacterized protein (TIGR02145 family)